MKKRVYNPFSERIVDILVRKVNNSNRHFFRILVAYYLCKIASMMRCNILTKDRGVIPVNTYVLNLMVSGAGKGHSINIMEKDFIAYFKYKFLEEIFPQQALTHMTALATEKATIRCASNAVSHSLDDEIKVQLNKLLAQFNRLGELAFSFDSATTPAVKQMREKLLLAGAGSMNFELDEVGSNMSGNSEVLTTFLELFDMGLVKQKLIKHTVDNIRSKELPGNTPTNLMLFGTPTKLLDGGRTEEEFMDFLETGYARRLLVGYTTEDHRVKNMSATERFAQMVDTSVESEIKVIQKHFEKFAQSPFNPVITVSEENSIHLIKYQIWCEERSDELKEHMSTQKAELIHRYYKALKVAGAYAFCEGSKEITKEHLNQAISLAEDSGEAFSRLMRKKGAYERLALYLAHTDKEVTQHELLEELPFYKGSEAQRRDMMTLAMAYGYKNNIIIRKRTQENIDFFSGETLQATDLNKVSLAISSDIAQGFYTQHAPFNQLHKVTTADNYHYTSHGFINGHRTSDNAISGFNLLIVDCDGDTSLNVVKVLMSDYTYLISTTKRHTAETNRFRLILPMSHRVKLEAVDYSLFMQNVYEWLPFTVDESTKDIARKWLTCKDAHYEYNYGELLDATAFIPHTKREEETRNQITEAGVDNIEAWFRKHTYKGNRANYLYRYGMVLVDAGLSLGEITEKLTNFNNSLEIPLPESQLRNSTLKSISKELSKKAQ